MKTPSGKIAENVKPKRKIKVEEEEAYKPEFVVCNTASHQPLF